MLNHAIEQYQNQIEVTYAPVDLLVACLDGLLQRIDWAASAMNEGRHKDKLIHLGKASEILSELTCALDPDPSPEIADNLSAVYSHADTLLVHAMTFDDLDALRRARTLVQTVAEGWKEAIDQFEQQQVQPTAIAGGH